MTAPSAAPPRLAGSAAPAVALLLAACLEQHRVAVVGYAFPAWGTPTVEAARQEIAALGPVPGLSLRIVYDSITQGDPADVEVERATRLAALPGIVAVVGHGGSRGSLVAAPIYNQAGIPQIVPIGTSRLLGRAGPWTFTLAANDSLEGAFIGRYAADALHARRIAVFYVNDEYGTGLRDGVQAAWLRRGQVITAIVPVEPTSDFPVLVDGALRRGRPDAVVVAARQRETGGIARAVQHRLPGTPVIAGDGALQIPALAELAGPAADAIHVVAFWLPDPADSVDAAFAARFRSAAGRDPTSTDAMSHDALLVLVHAIREVGPDRRAVRDYLSSLGITRPPYPGVTGPIAFTPDARRPLVMTRLAGGSVVRAGGP